MSLISMDLMLKPFIALALIGEGPVRTGGRVFKALDTDLEPLRLEVKEGLSLINGTEGMSAMAALGLDRARNLVIAADVACALTVEAMMGSARPFRSDISGWR